MLIEGEPAVFLPPLVKPQDYLLAARQLRRLTEPDDIFLSFGGRLTTLYGYLYFKGYRQLYSYELNAVPGRSIRATRSLVKKIFTYFPLKGKKYCEIGHPFEDAARKSPLNPYLRKVLFLSGSLGSEKVFQLAEEVAQTNSDLQVTLSCGTKERRSFKSPVKAIGMIDPQRYSDYDLVIARAGAGTIAHLLSFGLPSIFLPSPNVKDDHQLKNAIFLNEKAAVPYLEYGEQDAAHLNALIADYKPYAKRAALAARYRDFFHSGVAKSLWLELGLNA